MKNMIIGTGNAGCQIIKMAALSPLLDEVEFYAIDSVLSTIDMDSISNVKFIPIMSDEKAGSGRDRERGKAMFKFHEENKAFDEMYKVASESKTPVIVVSSAAGGTGSGSIVPLCDALIIEDFVRTKLTLIADELSKEITKSFRQSHTVGDNSCDGCNECVDKGIEVSLHLIEQLPYLRDMLAFDVKAAYEGDPAAVNYNEIIFSYPGLYAITVHRIANILYNQGIELIPRIMSEYSHSLTGIDIHPGATIGRHFFIDHGTGVVIGETTVIGDNVTLYQGVTLGGKSFPRDEQGNIVRGKKRHPTIEDGVTIYAGATILGGDTVIGRNSIIGGNVWIVSSIPPNSKVTLPENQTKMNIKTFF